MGTTRSSLARNTCDVCRKPVHTGLRCNGSSHLICSHCLSSYVTDHCESGHSLAVATGFVIRCPVKQCKSYLWRYSPHLQVDPSSSEILDSYVDSLLYFSIITLNKPSVVYYFRVSLALKILHGMVLHCPRCGVEMTKVRGTSCSAECRQCGAHFCWLCFKVNSDKETSRVHVTLCRHNPLKLLYPPVYCVEAVHRLHKIKFVRMVIQEVEREAQLIANGIRIEADFCGGSCCGSELGSGDEQLVLIMDLVESVLKELQPILMDNGIQLKFK